MNGSTPDGRSERMTAAWAVWAVTLAIAALRPILDLVAPPIESAGDHVFSIAAIASFATVGALIGSRHRGNRIGLLFTTVGAAAAISMTAGIYADVATERELPLAAIAAWVSSLAFAVMFLPLAFLFLLFPTGDVPGPRWRWLLWVMLVASTVLVVGFTLTPGILGSGFVDVHARIANPIAFPSSWLEPVQAVTQTAGLVVFAGALLSVVSLVLRFRRADPEERQQIRWLAFLAAFLAVWIVAFLTLQATGVLPEDASNAVGNIGFFVLAFGIFFGIPVASAVAILRYRLYDLDIVIKKAVVFGIVVVLLTVAFLVVAGVIGGLVGRTTGAAIAVAFVVGALLVPMWRLARGIADRLVYGGRTTPYEALTEFSDRLSEAYATDDVLPRMAAVLGESTRAASAHVWVRVGGVFRAAAAWPPEATVPGRVTTSGDELPALPGDGAVEIRHRGELLGALTVVSRVNDPVEAGRLELMRDLAAQGGIVLRNVRLIEELRASRQRLVAAQDEERRKLERNLHDGAQQQLVALAVQLKLARTLVDRDPAKASEMLDGLQTSANEALEDLRDLARGIYPPLLADRGLAAALEAQARKAAIPVTVDPDGIGRYAQEIESAVYFSCLEALNNVAKYADASTATVSLGEQDGVLTFDVVDDGRGFDTSSTSYGTGLQGIADRLEAIGGRFDVRSDLGSGTTLSGWITTEREVEP